MSIQPAIELFSPVPPMRTGTADYFEQIVERLRSTGIPRSQIRLVIDKSWLENDISSFMGYSVYDYRELPAFVENGVLRIYFVANNEYHSYVHRSLSECDRHPGGKIISVIHDAACLMINAHNSRNGINSFDIDQLIGNVSLQYGPKSRKFLDDSNSGNIPGIFNFTTSAQGHTIRKSDEIWTHSTFAFAKLFLESGCWPKEATSANFPAAKIVHHPVYDYEHGEGDVKRLAASLMAEKKDYRIGAFGWVAEPKRIMEAIRAFSLFLDRIEPKDRAAVEFIVAGKLPPAEIYDVGSEIRNLQLEDHIRLYDWVDRTMFRALFRTCDLICNLRYPSCGESSGTLSYGQGAHVRIMTTKYQAFNEDFSDIRINCLPGLEIPSIASSFAESYLNWASGRKMHTAFDELARDHTGVAPADKAIAVECIKHLIRAG